MDPSKMAASSLSYEKVVETYKNAAAMATAVTAYAVLARGMARELLPQELRDAALRAVSLLMRGRSGLRAPERRTFVIRRHDEEGDGALFFDARA
ncbi:hypothetical protein U9M48_015377 [Paspalum notatum var. saurae]|uniref:Uncharacterized protein n=1 Tax=Paspalum notatum var. saurae TaxID=547442 RepID=A0AAQ3WLR5_PASNO